MTCGIDMLQYHAYMHIVEPADENEARAPEWEGITGRVKHLLDLQSKGLKEDVAMVSRRQDEMSKLHEQLAMRQEGVAMALERIEALLLSVHTTTTTT